MDFKLSDSHRLQKELFRKIAVEQVAPRAEDMDEAGEFDLELLKVLQKYGLMSIPYSKDLGGQGGDYLGYALCVEEISAADASTGITISVHTSLACSCINEFGTPEQKEKWLRPMLEGNAVGCFGLTEANAGSDPAALQTKAELDGEEYIVDGAKMFITNSGFADTFLVFAKTDKESGTRGISCFVIDKDDPGLAIGKDIRRMGIRAASNCEISFDNIRIPKDRLLGKEGQGFRIAMKALDAGRIGVAAQSLGIAQGALNEAVKYTKERKQGGRRISSFQNTQFKAADLQTQIDAARLLVWRAAAAKDSGEKYSVDAAMAKLFASKTANDVTRECVQFMGGYGYSSEYPVERMMRDAKITEIYEGTSEVMRIIIAAAMKVK